MQALGVNLCAYLFIFRTPRVLWLCRHYLEWPIRINLLSNEDDIKGIKINDLETKLLQFADDTTVVLSDLDSARALFVLLDRFEKVSGLKLNVAKTEAMWIGSLQHCENKPLGVKWKTCVKFLGIFITCDVQILVEKNFKQRLKKIRNTIIYGSQGVCQFMARLTS